MSHRLTAVFARTDWRSPRTVALVVAGSLLALLAGLLAFLPVPYSRVSPGPATDTLGSVEGKALITIAGRATYPATGRLELTTVSVTNPDYDMRLIEALTGWFRSGVAVVPKDTVYDQSKSAAQIQAENTREMALSQKQATAAALKALDIDIESFVVVASLTDATPAAGKLKLGDRILGVDGTTITRPEQVVTAVRKHKPGEQVAFRVVRNGTERTENLTTTRNPADAALPFVGLSPGLDYKFPFDVRISLDDVGGPSAGMMFALGIIERLTPEEITGGRIVAGTGTITDDGAVGKIGGIVMKIRGARRTGATVFLVPAGNCREARAGAPKGIELVKVDTLRSALTALAAIRTGKASFPHC